MPSSCRPFCSLNGRPLPQPPTVSSSSGPSGGDQLPDSLWDVPVSSSHQRRQCKPSPYLLKARLCFCPLSLPGPFRATHACILSLSLPLCGLRVAQPPLCREEGVAFMGLFQKCHHIQGAPTRGPLNQHHFHLGRKLAPGPGGQLTGQQSLVSLGCVHHYSNLFSFPNKTAWCKWEREVNKTSISQQYDHPHADYLPNNYLISDRFYQWPPFSCPTTTQHIPGLLCSPAGTDGAGQASGTVNTPVHSELAGSL